MTIRCISNQGHLVFLKGDSDIILGHLPEEVFEKAAGHLAQLEHPLQTSTSIQLNGKWTLTITYWGERHLTPMVTLEGDKSERWSLEAVRRKMTK